MPEREGESQKRRWRLRGEKRSLLRAEGCCFLFPCTPVAEGQGTRGRSLMPLSRSAAKTQGQVFVLSKKLRKLQLHMLLCALSRYATRCAPLLWLRCRSFCGLSASLRRSVQAVLHDFVVSGVLRGIRKWQTNLPLCCICGCRWKMRVGVSKKQKRRLQEKGRYLEAV
jgi:hypothetical protein